MVNGHWVFARNTRQNLFDFPPVKKWLANIMQALIKMQAIAGAQTKLKIGH